MIFELRKNESLSNYTTLKIGGVADYVAVVKNEDELKAALQFALEQTATPPLILGGGSNVLCSDEGYHGLVIINNISGYNVVDTDDENILLEVGAGEVLDEVIEQTIKDGFWGLENLSAIPGSVGATPIQNVGAYGVEIADVIDSVHAINVENFEQKIFTKTECNFSYRNSFFKTKEGKKWCVVAVRYNLSSKPNPVLDYKDLAALKDVSDLSQIAIRNHVVQVRGQKFPDWKTVGTAGSFFKNPVITKEKYKDLLNKYPELPGFEVDEVFVKTPLGWILDKVCGLKGFKKGNVRLFEKQALVLVTDGEATATEVEDFVKIIFEKVKEKTGIEIEREVLSV